MQSNVESLSLSLLLHHPVDNIEAAGRRQVGPRCFVRIQIMFGSAEHQAVSAMLIMRWLYLLYDIITTYVIVDCLDQPFLVVRDVIQVRMDCSARLCQKVSGIRTELP